MEFQDQSSSAVRRRTLVKGAAWAAPAVMVGSAAPAFAASSIPPTFTFSQACKSPGNSCESFPKGYEFGFLVCNLSDQAIWLYTVTYTTSGTNLGLTHVAPQLPYRLAPGGCQIMAFRADSTNSGNQAFTATMTVTWGHTPVPGADPTPHPPVRETFMVTGTPPGCPCPGGAKQQADVSVSSSSSAPSSSSSSSSSSAPASSSAAPSPGASGDAATGATPTPAAAPSGPAAPEPSTAPAATPSSTSAGG